MNDRCFGQSLLLLAGIDGQSDDLRVIVLKHIPIVSQRQSSLRQHDSTSEGRQLTVSAGEVGFDPGGLSGPNAAERPTTAAQRIELTVRY